KDMLERHAENVLMAGVYLDVADLFMASMLENATLFFVSNVDEPKFVPMQEYFKTLGVQMPEPHPDCSDKPSEKWHVLLTRADYEACGRCEDLPSINHFMPVFESNEERVKKEIAWMKGETRRKDSELKAAIMELYDDASGMDENDNDALIEQLLDQVRLAEQRGDALVHMVTRISSMAMENAKPDGKWLVREAVSDGNCGLWTIMALQANGLDMSLTVDSDTFDGMLAWRERLSEAWMKVSSDGVWQKYLSLSSGDGKPSMPALLKDGRAAESTEQKEKRLRASAPPANKRLKMDPSSGGFLPGNLIKNEDPENKVKSEPAISQPLPVRIPAAERSRKGAFTAENQPKEEKQEKEYNRKSKKKVKTEPEHPERPEHGQADQDDQVAAENVEGEKPRQTRPYRRATADEKVQRQKNVAIRAVLATQFKLRYTQWHAAHTCGAPINGAASTLCDGKGWGDMLKDLTNQTLPSCTSCKQLLIERDIPAQLPKILEMMNKVDKISLAEYKAGDNAEGADVAADHHDAHTGPLEEQVQDAQGDQDADQPLLRLPKILDCFNML
ncbi:unnamed protein product, partial [Cladocopium goreaui]